MAGPPSDAWMAVDHFRRIIPLLFDIRKSVAIGGQLWLTINERKVITSRVIPYLMII